MTSTDFSHQKLMGEHGKVSEPTFHLYFVCIRHTILLTFIGFNTETCLIHKI